MIKVLLDNEGFFTGNYAIVGDIEGSVEAPSLPPTGGPQKAYKLVGTEWVLDTDKVVALNTQELEDRKEAIENEYKASMKGLANELALAELMEDTTEIARIKEEVLAAKSKRVADLEAVTV